MIVFFWDSTSIMRSSPRGSIRRFLMALAIAVAPVTAAAQSADYVIGPQDVLQISVYDQPNLSAKYAVEADGTFSFPLIGRIKAGGLTVREFEGELRKQLADGFFKDPQVTVAVAEYHSQRIFVVGEVAKPGTYPLVGGMTLIEALARAGSTTQSASHEAIIVRPKDGQEVTAAALPDETVAAERIHVNVADLQSGQAPNVPLRDGDTIFVPKADVVYVFGEVRNPGEYVIRRGTTLLQALSLAGGVTEYGSMGRTRIVRVVDGEKKEIRAKETDLVQTGDTIIVPERLF